MSSQKIKFGDKEFDKKEFCSSKQAILLDSVDSSKMMMVEKICHLLRMIKKFIKSIMKYGKQLENF